MSETDQVKQNLVEHSLQEATEQELKEARDNLAKEHAKLDTFFNERVKPSLSPDIDPLDTTRLIDLETVLVCDLNEAFDKYWYDYWRNLGVPVVDIGGAHCMHTDIPLFTHRGVWWTDWVRLNMVSTYKEISRFFREKGGWFSWYISKKEDNEQVQTLLYQVGLEKTRTWVGVHASSQDYRYVQIHPKFKFVHVNNAQQLGIFLAILAEEYGYDAAITKHFRSIFKTTGFSKSLLHFIAMYDGKPVACGTYLKSLDRACVYDLIVRPKYRRMGIGTWMLQEFVAFANVQRIEKVVLLAPDHALKFFSSCGFEEFERYYLYSPRV